MTHPDTDTLWSLLGFPDGPPPAGCGRARVIDRRPERVCETLTIETEWGPLPGTLLRPSTVKPRPAVLYCHAHGHRFDIGRRELLDARPALLSAYGPVLVEAGFAVLCVDMPGFNERARDGTESAVSKAALWRGRPLFGQMLAELSAALDYLTGRPDIDDTRIAALGLSMGATHAYWLAALDQRIAAVAHLCAFSNMGPLIETGAHDRHGPYMTVPGLLRHCDMADIAAMIAPRPQLVAAGGADPLTPPAALEPALATLRQAYADAGASDRLTIVVGAETGHTETPAMRVAVLRFLDQLAGINSP